MCFLPDLCLRDLLPRKTGLSDALASGAEPSALKKIKANTFEIAF